MSIAVDLSNPVVSHKFAQKVTDEALLLSLYNGCPSRSLNNYQKILYQTTGTYVDTSISVAGSTIDIHSREASGSRTWCLLTSISPKTSLALLTMAQKSLTSVQAIWSEKHLKGAEIFVRGVRRNPVTGVVPDTIVDSDEDQKIRCFTGTYRYTPVGFLSSDDIVINE
jgi:hypothetical protein